MVSSPPPLSGMHLLLILVVGCNAIVDHVSFAFCARASISFTKAEDDDTRKRAPRDDGCRNANASLLRVVADKSAVSVIDLAVCI